MKVLLEVLDDAAQLLKTLDSLGGMRPETRSDIEAILQGLCEESTRLLREVPAEVAVTNALNGMAGSPEHTISGLDADITAEKLHREWLMQRSLEALAAPDYERALRFLSEGAEAYPDGIDFLNHLGLVYWELGDFEQAADAYLRAMTAAFALAEDDDSQRGSVDWSDATNQDYLRAMEGRALCLCRLEAYDEALVLFDTLANISAVDYAGCRYMAGEIHHLRGNYSAAIEDYRLGPVEPASLYNLGLAYYQNGDSAAAAATFIRAFVSNIHVLHAFCARDIQTESCVPGYLGGRDYALDFVQACQPLWGNREDALDFMETCYDHVLVQAYLEQCRNSGGDSILTDTAVGNGQESWLDVISDESKVERLAENVVRRLYS
ncbi:tetratricopeptide repeat protein [Bradymonas sediminis]|nr:tetratricopeptide repeat protein [Bradymonas sediminis]TDP64355.1 tetratricopeptide repeat protein [Bradymonas sediminis]